MAIEESKQQPDRQTADSGVIQARQIKIHHDARTDRVWMKSRCRTFCRWRVIANVALMRIGAWACSEMEKRCRIQQSPMMIGDRHEQHNH